MYIPPEEPLIKKIGRWGLSAIVVGSFPMMLLMGYDIGGAEGLVFSALFFPFAFFLLPWYAAFFQNNWFPVVVVYLLGTICCILMGFGEPVDPYDETR
ncbi:MAG: hypothetical protein JSS86_10910 [Cyanobacteria bacterium SZAS LIN-2]|nr:hypothetical protein [Cyanobacteria bacterium SZAS LIN-3]MBS1996815.1 hypothetical protein [Cyanobacteria bacterium SZAS LIN-2]MBS2010865.1 hypothetical protein [Cyanobacteria bacterium SZAS TMP-1]